MRIRSCALGAAFVALAFGPAVAELPPYPAQPPGTPAPAPMQFLYGSGEAAATYRSVWQGIVAYAQQQKHKPDHSVILAAGQSSLAQPKWEDCGNKPRAVVFDVDETVILNAGFEYDQAEGQPYSKELWRQWEAYGANKTIPTPGAVEAINKLRAMKITVIFNTNRQVAFARQDEEAIAHAGFGSVHFDTDPEQWRRQTLYLAADDSDAAAKKDRRRAVIASHYCVIAMGGDQLGDFSDLFNVEGLSTVQRRDHVIDSGISDMWGNGWFAFPNPVYGSALKGTADQIFPSAVHWPDPQPMGDK